MRRSAFAAKHALNQHRLTVIKYIFLWKLIANKASSLSWLLTDRSFVFTKVNLENQRNSYYVHFYFFPPVPATHRQRRILKSQHLKTLKTLNTVINGLLLQTCDKPLR